MTPTPKELLESAQHAMDFAECGNTLTLARHILATVRADDDEPMSNEWMNVMWEPSECGLFWWLGLELYVETGTFGYTLWHAGIGSRPVILVLDITSRGQFRSLCRALGLTLPEVPA